MAKQSFKDRCFKDEEGVVVIGQKPNLPLIVAVCSFAAGLIVTGGKLADIIDAITYGAFFTFAWMELFQGVNYLRRLFGLLVLGLLIYHQVS